MARRFGLVLCIVAAAQALNQRGSLLLLDLAPPLSSADGPCAAYRAELDQVRELFANVSAALSSVEVGEEATAAGGGTDVPEVLRSLSGGIDTLRRVRSNVFAASDATIAPNVRMQVVWDIDRCALGPRGRQPTAPHSTLGPAAPAGPPHPRHPAALAR